MDLRLLTWRAPLFCHAPADEPFDPAALGAPGDHRDRWCRPGEPTAYLASDAGVALAELARHHPPGSPGVERLILRLQLDDEGVAGLVDVRDPATREALGGPASPAAFLELACARELAARTRDDPRHRGLVVPSMAFLDQPGRCTVVLFAERWDDLGSRLGRGSMAARVVLGGS